MSDDDMAAAPRPELLSPAGSWESLKAAVANGADAVYFGVEAFNARLRAENFRRRDLPDVMAWLHARGVKGFLTVNVLVFPGELAEAGELLLAAERAGVDALIVQDIGLARLAGLLTPDLALHGSTQMSITSAAGVAQAADLGCERVVLARELSLRDIGRIQAQLQARGLGMPLEVFVHGALCVAYSGQCLTSEALGQRSANRGECAQACRLPYQLIVDGVERDLGEQRYLLSPQDLAAWDLLPQLAAAGVASLKIEGRLKDPTYVAAVTDAYRQGLDRLEPQAQRPEAETAAGELRRHLELSFSRGLGTGWLEGVNHRRLVQGRWSKKRGPWLGRLEAQERGGWLVLATALALKPGDGVVFEAPSRDPLAPPIEVGARVMAVERRPAGRLALRLGPGRIDTAALGPGSPAWLTSDPQLDKRFARMAQQETTERRLPLRLQVGGRAGEPLRLRLEQVPGLAGGPWQVESAAALQPATGAGLDAERLTAQLGRLGGTRWQLMHLELALPPGLFLPVAQLNQLRRELVAQLDRALAAGGGPGPDAVEAETESGRARLPLAEALRQLQPVSVSGGSDSRGSDSSGSALSVLASSAGSPVSPPIPPSQTEPQLTVLVRSLEQLQALVELPEVPAASGSALHRVVADIEHPAQLRQAVALGRGRWPGGLWLTGPRIVRPDEAWSLEPLLRAEPDGYLVRNADQLERLTPQAPCIGDFSLNVANPLTAAWFLERWGLERVTASYDLALDQLLALVAGCPTGSLELTLHQHMPLFHMEHCLFCAFLSNGHDHTDCGRPCEHHTVLLRDRSGVEHPLKADLGCRNTLFNGKAQTAAEAIPQLLRSGVRHFRLELLDETPADTGRRVGLYLDALAGRISGRQLWQQEQLDSRLGVTRGSLRPDGALR
ncbi:U32 family peptidase [Vulcanococcus limneticus]|uniref:U32 family peptidase n=1 Tax=Vulcanococcus limneticus TaxID=2170428 RepID=UPI001E45C340|nr:U32 family peptidase [Vulcanococcus limneticus]